MVNSEHQLRIKSLQKSQQCMHEERSFSNLVLSMKDVPKYCIKCIKQSVTRRFSLIRSKVYPMVDSQKRVFNRENTSVKFYEFSRFSRNSRKRFHDYNLCSESRPWSITSFLTTKEGSKRHNEGDDQTFPSNSSHSSHTIRISVPMST